MGNQGLCGNESKYRAAIVSDTHTYMLYGSHMNAHDLLNRTLSVYTSFYAAIVKALVKRRTKRKIAEAAGA